MTSRAFVLWGELASRGGCYSATHKRGPGRTQRTDQGLRRRIGTDPILYRIITHPAKTGRRPLRLTNRARPWLVVGATDQGRVKEEKMTRDLPIRNYSTRGQAGAVAKVRHKKALAGAASTDQSPGRRIAMNNPRKSCSSNDHQLKIGALQHAFVTI